MHLTLPRPRRRVLLASSCELLVRALTNESVLNCLVSIKIDSAKFCSILPLLTSQLSFDSILSHGVLGFWGFGVLGVEGFGRLPYYAVVNNWDHEDL